MVLGILSQEGARGQSCDVSDSASSEHSWALGSSGSCEEEASRMGSHGIV